MSTVFDAIKAAAPAGCMITDTTWNGASFVGGLVNLFLPSRVVEIGSCRGFTSAYIANAMRENGRGEFIAYELDPARASETHHQLSAAWPGGAWTVVTGDFFAELKSDAVDFVFLDIDPKSLYIPAFEKIAPQMPAGSVLVAHDLDYDPNALRQLDRVMVDAGWSTFGLHRERGFLIGVKG